MSIKISKYRVDMNGVQMRWSKGADVASATALSLGSDGNYFDITGTTTITSIGTKAIGTIVKLHFDGALTLTHHSTDLILPGAANITTAAGDEAEFVEYATGDWRCVNYQVASSAPGGGGGGLQSVQIFTASGTWTKPAGINLIKVTVVGGGGGGGGGTSGGPHQGGSGGGGGSAIDIVDVSAVSSVTVTIGSGGSGGAATVNGSNGGTTSFGAYCSGAGGPGGSGSSTLSNPAAGGAGSGGIVNIPGGNSTGATGAPSTNISYRTKGGGDTPFGFGGYPGYEGIGGAAAQAGQGYGAGGGGGGENAAAAAGSAGIVIVEEYA